MLKPTISEIFDFVHPITFVIQSVDHVQRIIAVCVTIDWNDKRSKECNGLKITTLYRCTWLTLGTIYITKIIERARLNISETVNFGTNVFIYFYTRYFKFAILSKTSIKSWTSHRKKNKNWSVQYPHYASAYHKIIITISCIFLNPTTFVVNIFAYCWK